MRLRLALLILLALLIATAHIEGMPGSPGNPRATDSDPCWSYDGSYCGPAQIAPPTCEGMGLRTIPADDPRYGGECY